MQRKDTGDAFVAGLYDRGNSCFRRFHDLDDFVANYMWAVALAAAAPEAPSASSAAAYPNLESAMLRSHDAQRQALGLPDAAHQPRRQMHEASGAVVGGHYMAGYPAWTVAAAVAAAVAVAVVAVQQRRKQA